MFIFYCQVNLVWILWIKRLDKNTSENHIYQYRISSTMPVCQQDKSEVLQPNEVQDSDWIFTDETPINDQSNETVQEFYNGTWTNETTTESNVEQGSKWLTLTELQIIKAVVLALVVGILLLSTCRIFFKTISKYQTKRPDV